MFSRIARMLAVAILAIIAMNAPSRAQDAETQKAIVELLQVSGIMKTLDQIAIVVGQNVVQQVKKKNPNVSEKAELIINEEFAAAFRNGSPGFMASVAPMYAKYFTLNEIRDLTAFYKTKTGQKAMQTLPLVLQESMTLGQKWAQQIVPSAIEKIKTRLHAEGINL